jgi:hypothetical protein
MEPGVWRDQDKMWQNKIGFEIILRFLNDKREANPPHLQP